MKIGTEDKKKLITAGVLGFLAIFAVGYLYFSLFGGPATPPPAPPVIVDKTVRASPGAGTVGAAVVPGLASPAVVKPGTTGKAAVKLGTVSGQLDPTLHMEGMLAAESLVYTGTGRNIFAAGPQQAPAPVLEKAKFDARPKPMGPVVPVNTGPPPPPPINLKFFGVATQKGVRRALLLSGDDVFLASPGDIVQRRYRIVTIAANSITVEDLPNSNKQNLPLTAN